MFGMRMKDLALVAFAGGLLAIELVGLQAAVPAALRSLAGVTGMPLVQSAARTARVATRSMVNGFTNAAAQAAVGGIESAVPGAFSSAIDGAAERVAAATPIRVAPLWGLSERTAPHAGANGSYRYIMVVRGARAAAAADARLVAWQSAACRAEVRAILAAKRAERARERAQKQAEAARPAITAVSEAASL